MYWIYFSNQTSKHVNKLFGNSEIFKSKSHLCENTHFAFMQFMGALPRASKKLPKKKISHKYFRFEPSFDKKE